ncbi:hypothetical protein OROGR_016233 [Orobanche gracilis]
MSTAAPLESGSGNAPSTSVSPVLALSAVVAAAAPVGAPPGPVAGVLDDDEIVVVDNRIALLDNLEDKDVEGNLVGDLCLNLPHPMKCIKPSPPPLEIIVVDGPPPKMAGGCAVNPPPPSIPPVILDICSTPSCTTLSAGREVVNVKNQPVVKCEKKIKNRKELKASHIRGMKTSIRQFHEFAKMADELTQSVDAHGEDTPERVLQAYVVMSS